MSIFRRKIVNTNEYQLVLKILIINMQIKMYNIILQTHHCANVFRSNINEKEKTHICPIKEVLLIK